MAVQPCPSEKNRTFCPTNPNKAQCKQPPCDRPAAPGGWIEWVAVPVPDMEGSKEQDVFYRMLKMAPNGTVLEARFWDTYSFLGTEGPGLPNDVNYGATITGMGSPAGSGVDLDFYATVLEQQRWWAAEFENEGVMEFELPRRCVTVHRRKHGACSFAAAAIAPVIVLTIGCMHAWWTALLQPGSERDGRPAAPRPGEYM